MIPRYQPRVSAQNYNVIDQMKKTNVPVSMWDALALPGKMDMIQAALQSYHMSNPVVVQQDPKVLIVESMNIT